MGELDSLGEVLIAGGLCRGFTAPSDWDEELDSLLETLDSLHEEPTSPGKVLNSLGFSSLAVPEGSSLATLGVSSLAMLHEGQKGLDHGFKALDETSWISKVLLLATAAWGLQVHQVVPW